MDPQQPPQQVNHDATMINSFGLPMSFGKQKNFNHNYAANHNSGAMMENVQHQQHQQHQQHHYQHHQNVQHRGNYNNNNYNHRGNRQKREHHQHSSHQHQHHQQQHQHNYNKRPRFNNHHSTSQNHHNQNQQSQQYKSNNDDHFDVTQYFKPSFLQDPWQPRVSHPTAVFSPPTIVDPSMQEEVKRLDETGTTSTSQETVLVDTANNGVVDVVTSNEEIMNPECIDI